MTGFHNAEIGRMVVRQQVAIGAPRIYVNMSQNPTEARQQAVFDNRRLFGRLSPGFAFSRTS
jgi:hypothetical protein